MRDERDVKGPCEEPDAVILLTTRRIRRIWNPTGRETKSIINNFLIPPGLGPPEDRP